MKRNETILVYAVTGLLLLILAIAVIFGEQPATKPSEQTVAQSDLPTSSTQLPGVTPALLGEGAGTPDGPAGGRPEAGRTTPVTPETEKPRDGSNAPVGGTPSPAPSGPIAGGSSADGTTPTVTPVGLAKSVEVPAAAPAPEQVLETRFGTSRRMGDFRVVRAWSGASLRDVVQRWCGDTSRLGDVELLNESVDPKRLTANQEVIVPWVEASSLLAAAEVRHAVPAVAPAAAGTYSVGKGESLWKIASRRVPAKKIPAWIARFREINPEVSDPNALREGQKVRLPK
ncbi:MAG: LysM peptidoglycan-binding domain-containing protein [Planctomycetes bacterium]|nr:LysM peptidoglycan-binding domain-containing protein [Planctomycetota bacterium]